MTVQNRPLHHNLPNLIIAGAARCGTTSLHTWLTAHPDVAGPSRKETGYFVDEHSHAFNPLANFRIHGLSGYEKYFDHGAARRTRILLEVAPDYMCQQTAVNYLPLIPSRPHFLFILREPAAQIYSLFNYLKNNFQYLRKDMSFASFIELSRERSSDLAHHELLQNAVANGHYIALINQWIERAGVDHVNVCLFEDMVAENLNFMKGISADLGIDPTFYQRYHFPIENETYRARSTALQSLNIAVRKRLSKGPAYHLLRRMYRRFNTAKGQVGTPDEDLRLIDQLREDYTESNRALAEQFTLDLRCWSVAAG